MRGTLTLMEISGCDLVSSKCSILEDIRLSCTNLCSVWASCLRSELQSLQPAHFCSDTTACSVTPARVEWVLIERRFVLSCVSGHFDQRRPCSSFLIFCLHIPEFPSSWSTFPVVPVALSKWKKKKIKRPSVQFRNRMTWFQEIHFKYSELSLIGKNDRKKWGKNSHHI